jgi:hypothetical protein
VVLSAGTKGRALFSLDHAQSLRDHWLDLQNKRLEADRLSYRPGKQDRAALLASASAVEEKTRAEDRFADALNELMGIDVYLLDPVRGVAFVPFQKEEQLAWFVFDLFDSNDLKTWRFHEDPLEMRRPIAELDGPAAAKPEDNK